MVQSGTARCGFQSPCPTDRTASRIWVALAVVIAHAEKHDPIPNGGHRSSQLASVVRPDRFRTTDVRPSALNAWRRPTYFEALGDLLERPRTEPERRDYGKA